MASVVSSTLPARRRLIRSVRPTNSVTPMFTKTLLVLNLAVHTALSFGADPIKSATPAKSIGSAQLYWLLDRACCYGDVIGAQMLLDAGADPDGLKDYPAFQKTEWGYLEPSWPINQASRNGHLEVVELLLKRGARADNIEGESHTALTLAAAAGHTHIVSRLLTAGADHTHKEVGGTALEIATKKTHIGAATAIRVFLHKQKK